MAWGYHGGASTAPGTAGGHYAGPGGGAPTGMTLGGPGYGYNPDIVAAHAPAVNTGNEVGSWPPATPTKWGSYDMPIKAPTDWYANPTSGWESFPAGTYPGGGAYGFPAQMNPYPAFNIDNITQPASFAGYPNQTGIPTGGYVGAPYVNPASMPIGGGLDVGSGGGYNGGGREGAGRD